MEQFTLPENLENRLINLLKEKRKEDKETFELLKSWTLIQEKWAEDSEDYRGAQIEVNLQRARLYFKASYTNDCLENFEDARMQAWNEKREELYQAIMEEMDKLGL